jgi:hypothetical protein
MNPALRHLGFSPTDRVVVFHADDIGSCHSSLAAYAGLIDFGLLSSAATMAPCAWFPATAAYCREHRESPTLDMGVHLTLTSEWSTIRWGPVSRRDHGSGLVDAEGYFHRRAGAVDAEADLAAVEQELRAQIDAALAAGIDVTHIDTHMLTLWQSRFARLYVELAKAYRVPLFLPRTRADVLESYEVDPADAAEAETFVQVVEAQGLPVFDHWHVMSLANPDDRLGQARRVLDALEPGLTNFIVHPGVDTPELRAMAPDWRCRVADHALFTAEAWRHAIRESGVHVVGFRTLRDGMINP